MVSLCYSFTPVHQYAYSPYVSQDVNRENMFHNQDLLQLVVISSSLETLKFDSVIL